MGKLKIKKGDQVFVIAGSNKDLTASKTVVKVLPSKNKAIVEGVNVVKKHVKPSAENPQGGIKEFEMPIQISNLAISDPIENKPSRVGYKIEDGMKVRFSKLSGNTI